MPSSFRRISEIDPDQPASWEGATFLTFDIDWAHDAVVGHALDAVEAADVAATWFVTHDSPVLARLRENPKMEVAAHPNFNPLLAGGGARTAASILEDLRRLAPEATAVRSHSLVQGTPLAAMFRDVGFTHDCNDLIESRTMRLAPWRSWSGLIKAPHFWADDMVFADACTGELDLGLEREGLRVLDFHPIHVFLNTDTATRYEAARPHFQSPDNLAGMRNTAVPGARDWLDAVLGLAS